MDSHKKKMTAPIVVTVIIILSIIIYTFIENNDDFAPYISKEYDKVYDIHSDIYDLSKIESELTEIAQEYEEGLKLTFVQYDIEENLYNCNGVITEISANNIVFKNQSSNKKYLIDVNNDFKFINGRTNEEINANDIFIQQFLQ